MALMRPARIGERSRSSNARLTQHVAEGTQPIAEAGRRWGRCWQQKESNRESKSAATPEEVPRPKLSSRSLSHLRGSVNSVH